MHVRCLHRNLQIRKTDQQADEDNDLRLRPREVCINRSDGTLIELFLLFCAEIGDFNILPK
jgi:hypothetical protein